MVMVVVVLDMDTKVVGDIVQDLGNVVIENEVVVMMVVVIVVVAIEEIAAIGVIVVIVMNVLV